MRAVSRGLALCATAAAVLGLSASSAVAQTTIGEVASPSPPVRCVDGPINLMPAGFGRSTYTVPAAGLLTSWSTSAGNSLLNGGPGQLLTMKVYRPIPPGVYLVVGHDGPRPLVPKALNTFPISIPVQAGDLIGLNSENAAARPNACQFETGNVQDLVEFQSDVPGNDGEVIQAAGDTEKVRLNVSATLLRAPSISTMAPASGSILGGTPVILAGSEFARVSSVTVGGVPAPFNVASEGQITLTVPPGGSLAPAPVVVTTATGAATAPIAFSYQGCQVPKLVGKKLKASKRQLRQTECKIGKVKLQGEATAKSGRVVKQNPKPDSLVAPGTKVNVKVGLSAKKR